MRLDKGGKKIKQVAWNPHDGEGPENSWSNEDGKK